ncbi:unnamed protein product [Symbiodinium sp. KB8]|nr:unnamed protein product [Symbiodinium sp. KB8]
MRGSASKKRKTEESGGGAKAAKPGAGALVPYQEPVSRPRAPTVFICGFCKASSKEVEFSSVDDPRFAVCYPCGDNCTRLRPNANVVSLLKIYLNDQGARANDPDFKNEFDEALPVYKAKVEAGTLPSCNPSAEVHKQTEYGFTLYQKWGVVTDAEYSELVDRVPTEIKKTPVPFQWQGPHLTSNHHLISLAGLSRKVTNGLKKIKVTYTSSAGMQENYVSEASQVHQAQAANVFRYVFDKHMDSRPDLLRPTATSKPPTVNHLIQEHEKQEQAAARVADSLADAASCPAPADSSDVAIRSVGFAGSLEGQTQTAAAKRKLKKQMQLPGQEKAPSVSAKAGSGAAPSLSGKGGAPAQGQEKIAHLDHDLQTIAKAKLILKNLRNNNLVVSATMLEKRIAACEHAQKLSVDTIKHLKVTDLRVHVRCTEAIWDIYPMRLQCEIAFRFAQHELIEAHGLWVMKSEEQPDAPADKFEVIEAFCAAVDLQITEEESVLDVEKFSEHTSSVGAVLQRLYTAATQAQAAEGDVSDLETSMQAMLDGDVQDNAQLAQAFATCYTNVFRSDAFIGFLKLEQAGHEAVAVICKHVLSGIEEASDILQKLEAVECLAVVVDAVSRVRKVLRCLAHLLSEDGLGASHEDVFYISKYSGKAWLERSIASVIGEQGTDWNNMLCQVVRVSGKAALLTSEKSDLVHLLSQDQHLDAVQLERVRMLHQQLSTCMRTKELQKIEEQMIARFTAHAKDLLGQNATGTAVVNQLLLCLNLFSVQPGVLSLVKDVQQWMTGQVQNLVLGDLCAMCESDTGPINWGRCQQLLEKLVGSDVQPPQGLIDHADAFLGRMWRQVADGAERASKCHGDEAAADDMTLRDVKVNLTTTMMLAKFVYSERCPVLVQMLDQWSSALQQGVLVAGALVKLQSLGSDAETLLKKEKNFQLVTNTYLTLRKVKKHMQAAFELRTSQDLAVPWALEDLQPVSWIWSLDALDICKDCVHVRATHMANELASLAQKLSDLNDGNTADSWKRGLSKDSDFEAVLAEADATIRKLPAKDLRTNFARFEKELAGWESFYETFSDGTVTFDNLERENGRLLEVAMGAPRDSKIMLLENFLLRAIQSIRLAAEGADLSVYRTSLQLNMAYLSSNNLGISEADVHHQILECARPALL